MKTFFKYAATLVLFLLSAGLILTTSEIFREGKLPDIAFILGLLHFWAYLCIVGLIFIVTILGFRYLLED